MSTKSTIYSSEEPNIHIYHELLDGTVWVDWESISAGASIRLMTDQEWEKLIAEQKLPKVSIGLFGEDPIEKLEAEIKRLNEEVSFLQEAVKRNVNKVLKYSEREESFVDQQRRLFQNYKALKKENERLRTSLGKLADKKNYYYTCESTNFIDPDTKTIMPTDLYARKALEYEGGGEG